MKKSVTRRQFLKASSIAAFGIGTIADCRDSKQQIRPNLVYVFADQWRAQATGYAGDPNAITPNLDALAKTSVNLTTAVSCCPVCTPYRASLLTGQYPLTNGVFINDVRLDPNAETFGKILKKAGYDTAYIGKWHLDGRDRSAFIPRKRRQGFDYWKAFECTHKYMNSFYYADENVKLKWNGYDAEAQTRDAQKYIKDHSKDKPFALFLSWGPPHSPLSPEHMPEQYRKPFTAEKIILRPNVPEEYAKEVKKQLVGYYAHIYALDQFVGGILQSLHECNIEKNTILVFTSDHGDMLYSQGQKKKQQPWDESILVPFLVHYPAVLGRKGKRIDMPFNTPDIMPTLLGLCGITIPNSVEGNNFSSVLKGEQEPDNEAALIMCPAPFGQYRRSLGGKEYRGIRTRRYTFVRDLEGPWLLYDNKNDPYQMQNLVNKPETIAVQRELEVLLSKKLQETNDAFKPAEKYIKKWDITVDETGTVPYTI